MKIITDDGQEFSVEQVKITELSMADTILFKTRNVVSDSGIARIKETLKNVFGADVQCVVLEDGADIEILRRKAKELYCPMCEERKPSTYTHEYHLHKNEDGTFTPHQLLSEPLGTTAEQLTGEDGGYVMTGEQAEALKTRLGIDDES